MNDKVREALAELVACDDSSRTIHQSGIHDHGCPATRHGRTVRGPCNCPGDAATARVDAAWVAARAALAWEPAEPVREMSDAEVDAAIAAVMAYGIHADVQEVRRAIYRAAAAEGVIAAADAMRNDRRN